MPQRQLTPQEWHLVVRTVADLKVFLTAIDGNTLVEAGTDGEAGTSFVVDTAADRQALAAVLRALGFDPAVDAYPPPVRDQLASLMGFAPALRQWKKPADDDQGG